MVSVTLLSKNHKIFFYSMSTISKNCDTYNKVSLDNALSNIN